ncbi:flagellar type III secretion system pore protein FliP [Chthonobacter rhizosphaerae]|uniref:flagellar type III secretion system pore protein FliP n=1 Tax=Chthonobacter rhizosphaerae TaxID=2735553 RepID=UPI0015EEF586|nr:flagellar type III secretion system pore protein FliP [Chthonobacter rhizosphaerae]
MTLRLLAVAGALVLTAGAAAAQTIDLSQVLPAGEASAAGRIVQVMAVLTVLSLAPGILVMVTSFTRFVIAFSFLRSGLGLPSTPSNLILISLSLFMTFYVMESTFQAAWRDGLRPLLANEITEQEAFGKIVDPFRSFMLDHVREKDLALFQDLRSAPGSPAPAAPAADEAVPLTILIPAFMISELRRAFEIGFLIALPFLVIDMIVATVVMSMGMMMMPPAVVALPFKVLFFVLIDGWNILVAGLVRSYG